MFISLFALLSPFSYANSAKIDPYIGIYHAAIPYTPYAVIKKHGERYFAVVSTGSFELVVNDKGEFNAKNKNIPLSGKFEQLVDGIYQHKVTNLFGQQYTYVREDMPEEAFIPALYSDDVYFEGFSHAAGQHCAKPYSKQDKSTNEVINNSKRMSGLISKIEKSDTDYSNINSLLVLKDDKLVFEKYFNGWKADEPHTIQSVSKSLTSLLAGIATQQGYIANVNTPVSELLPKYKDMFSGRKSEIALKHLLMMASGLYWDEWSTSYEDPKNLRSQEMASEDSVAFTLSQPMSQKPGEKFTYSGGSVSVVGDIIRQATKADSVSDYAKNGPLSALCFDNAYWMKQTDQRSNVAGGVMLRPRDMMKLGHLVLNEGQWNGKQLLDANWLSASTTPVMPTSLPGYKYSYFWWNTQYIHNGKKYQAVNALGYGGQEIVIIKELDLVVVKTASNFHISSLIGTIMAEHILPTFAG
ncbi:beta-lactamase family protein [Photobacterium sp. ZSDE20]|uniref:Beta-lactamase family protein n=1 Tax=Photobacterium pectinilyticum TaxID=2906793 RepID=A0ABT1N7Y0_9GAMM|nr:serine hydrolase [Photobacterium sp. ZSDE20]MCQ1060862.1 beta-lactamase family protein [Photobacterium sp. ZSDE20]MDD1828685.1 beta-lactamase family protein [Photobacterium sp. ZSDE20]